MPQNTPDDLEKRYWKLDRFLLHLLAGEIGYYLFLIIAGFFGFLFMRVFFSDFDLSGISATVTLILVLAYILLLPVNAVGALLSILATIKGKRQGFPGVGHLLNWILLVANAWILLLTGFVLLISSGMVD